MLAPWNKNVVVGRKSPLSAEEVKLLKLSIKLTGNKRDELLLHLAIDTSLRGVDLVKLKVKDICDSSLKVKEYFYIKQSKTSKNVMCNLSEDSRKMALAYILNNRLELDCYLFTSLYKIKDGTKHLTPHHYRELIKKWLKNAGLDVNTIEKNVTFDFKKIYNVKVDDYEGIDSPSVLDSTKVLIQSLKTAVSIANILLSTGSLIINEQIKNIDIDHDINI